MRETFKTCRLNLLVPVIALMTSVTALGQGLTYHLGTPATAEEIRPLDIAIGPSGKELPPGSGTSQEGAKIYAGKCAVCHGPTGTEHPAAPRPLVGGQGRRNLANRVFATSIWDSINRAMPANEPGTLNADEVYALTAFLLYRNDIIQESDVIDAQSLPKIQMPNRK